MHAVVQPSRQRGTSDSTRAQTSALTTNPNLDPGPHLSAAAPAFTLTDQFGQPVSLSSFRGKVVILAFNDAECTTICPLTTAALVDAKEMLGAAGSQVQLLGIDANPKAIAVEDVLSYSQLHGMLYQWRYLTGSLAQLQSVWKAYSVGVTISQNQTDHEPAIFVIDQQGRLAKLYLTQLAYSAVGQLGQLLANEVSSLLPSHPAVHSHLSYAQIGGISPATEPPCPRRAAGTSTSAPASPARAAAPGSTCSSRPGTRRSPASAASSTRSTPTSRPRPRPASRPDRDRRGQRRAVGVGAARLPEHPAAAAVLPGRDRRQRAGGGRLRGAGRALVRADLGRRKGHLVLGSVHLGLAADRRA